MTATKIQYLRQMKGLLPIKGPLLARRLPPLIIQTYQKHIESHLVCALKGAECEVKALGAASRRVQLVESYQLDPLPPPSILLPLSPLLPPEQNLAQRSFRILKGQLSN